MNTIGNIQWGNKQLYKESTEKNRPKQIKNQTNNKQPIKQNQTKPEKDKTEREDAQAMFGFA